MNEGQKNMYDQLKTQGEALTNAEKNINRLER